MCAILGSGRGEADTVVYGAGVPRLADAKAAHIADAHVYTFAHTFPTGTHAMWLYYWLASAGIDPFNDVRTHR
jgi:ABC-type nitrate/sulfonate/bicarbonate transport system substrate-binding protein